MNTFAAFFAGLLFAIGLGISGMTQPRKVVAFLDFAGDFDASLAFVMIGAIAVHFAAQQLRTRRARPLFAANFSQPAQSAVDARLLIGAALFGIGWGLGGCCPGPAVVSLAAGAHATLVFAGAMLAGMLIFRVGQAITRRPS